MGAWTEIVDYTVPSNTTSVVLNDFGTITKDDFIKIVVNVINTFAGDANIALFANTATTLTDYHRQVLLGNGSSVSAFGGNLNLFLRPDVQNVPVTAIGYIKLSENDRFNYFVNRTDRDDSSLKTTFEVCTSSGATFTSGVTTLTLTSNRTDGIGTDTRIQIYRLDAEKVADITVASNSTQVDIPVTGSLDPAINKDSEYLLMSYAENATTTSAFLTLMVNDNTTATNYHRQVIQGVASSASAGRANNADYMIAIRNNYSPLGPSIAYTHIKLSEIGAFTYQSYCSHIIGTGDLELRNFFGSSTAEDITSITKLNVVASFTNAIKAGSRFELYKLK
jgi:hypothetical protein